MLHLLAVASVLQTLLGTWQTGRRSEHCGLPKTKLLDVNAYGRDVCKTICQYKAQSYQVVTAVLAAS